MKNSHLLGAVGATLLLFTASTAAVAAIIDFEGLAAPGGTASITTSPYVEDGFDLAFPIGISVFDSAQTNANTTGSAYIQLSNNSAAGPISLSDSGGANFDLTSVDVGSGFDPGFGLSSFNITGHISGGGTTVANVVNADVFSTLVLDWTNLTSVDFTFVTGQSAGIDNIVVSSVPLPAAVWLFGAGLLGLIGIAKSKKAA
jgi:hypothetical protein